MNYKTSEQSHIQIHHTCGVMLGAHVGKSCRLRWFNQLDPRISKRPFSDEEERLMARTASAAISGP
jgi:hypothetical protein